MEKMTSRERRAERNKQRESEWTRRFSWLKKVGWMKSKRMGQKLYFPKNEHRETENLARYEKTG